MKINFSALLVLILVMSVVVSANAQPGGRGHQGGGPGGRSRQPGQQHPIGIHSNLTEEQRAQLHELVTRMRDEGAGREEIRTAVEELFAGWGMELPDRPMGRARNSGMGANLTEEQRAQLHELVTRLREEGAGREEIRAAVEELFAEWGIEMPEGRRFFGRHMRHKFMYNLTDEQRRQVRQLVREKRQSGAFREEIRNAVLELLKEWGIEPPEKPDDPGALNKKYPTEKTVEAVNYPNPFNPTTRISYQVREPGNVSVEIFNIQGQMIRTLQDRYHESGEFSAHWDGLDDNGQAVASGTFIYRIHTPAGSVSKQMTLMK